MPTSSASADYCCQCPWPQSRQATIHPRLPRRPPNTPGRSSSVACGSTAPLPWLCTGIFYSLQVSLLPSVLWKFCIQILMTFKVRFSGDPQSICQISRLGNLIWGLEPSQQCDNFFGVIVLSCGSSGIGL